MMGDWRLLPPYHWMALQAAARGRARVRELEQQLHDVRAVYVRKIRSLEAKLLQAEGAARRASAGGGSTSPPLAPASPALGARRVGGARRSSKSKASGFSSSIVQGDVMVGADQGQSEDEDPDSAAGVRNVEGVSGARGVDGPVAKGRVSSPRRRSLAAINSAQLRQKEVEVVTLKAALEEEKQKVRV